MARAYGEPSAPVSPLSSSSLRSCGQAAWKGCRSQVRTASVLPSVQGQSRRGVLPATKSQWQQTVKQSAVHAKWSQQARAWAQLLTQTAKP